MGYLVCRQNRDDYFWSHIADATELTKMLLSATEESEASWDADTMRETVGHDVWSRLIRLDVIEVHKNRGTAWTSWGFSTGGEWLVKSLRWTEMAMGQIRELLAVVGGEEDTRDWIKVRKLLSEGTEDFLRGKGKGRSKALVTVNPVREFDGKGKGWNGWEFTEKGRELAEKVS